MKTEDEIEYEQFLTKPSCVVLRHLNYEDRCEFATSHCAEEGTLMNYVLYVYCILKPMNWFTEFLCILHILTWCIVLFLITTVTADEFFCPPLKVLSTVLKMSEHLAGVTLLAFGNGSADLFTTIVSVNSNDRLFYNDVSGGALFVVGLVAGVVCIASPFKLIPSSFLKDVCFLLLGALIIDLSLGENGEIRRWQCFVIFSLYFIYIIVVVMDQILVTRELTKKQDDRKFSAAHMREIDELRSQAQMEMTIIKNNERKTVNPNKNRMSFKKRAAESDTFKFLIMDLLKSLNPFDYNEWKNASIILKIWTCIKAPILMILRIFIPICDYAIEGHGWCKPLNCVQIVILPAVVILFIFTTNTYFGVPVCIFSMVITVPLAITLWCLTNIFSPPKCHWIFALYGCFGSIFIIYVCSSEVVAILNVIGIITGCNDAYLGCTLLAVGNNLGDFVANISLARQGYQKMAFSACFGGPLFNAHISFGLVLIINTFKSEDGIVTINLGPLRENLAVFIILILITTIFIIISTDFFCRKSVGVCIIILYFIFLLFSTLSEAEIIQTWRNEVDSTKRS